MKLVALGMAVMLLEPSAPQGDEPTIEEELLALVAKVDAHGSFRLRYSGTGEDEEEGEMRLEIAYSAPDAMSAKVEGLDEGFELVFDDYDLFVRSRGESWKVARMRRSAAADLFERLFPTPGAIGPGPMLNMRADSGGFRLSTSYSPFGRRSFFACFSPMIARPQDVVREDGRLVWKEDGLTLAISRESGFPEAIDISYEDRHVSLRLEEIDADPAVERPPEAEPDAELQASVDQLAIPRAVRTAAFTRLALQLGKGMRALDEAVRRDFEAFLEALHAEWLDQRLGDWPREVRESIDALTRGARETDDRTALEAEARSRRAELVAILVQASADHLETVTELGGGELPAELLGLERTVIERVHAQRLSGPLLAYFDEQIDVALGD